MSTLGGSSPWIRLDEEHWRPVITGKRPRRYPKEDIIYHQGQPSHFVYIIKSGRVRVTSYQPNGMEKQFYIAEKGCIFGENSYLSRQCHRTAAVAIVDSELYSVEGTELEAAMAADYEFTRFMLQVLCHKNNIFSAQILELSFAHASVRVVHALLNLGQEYGVPTPEGLRISIRFTHQDIANIINTSRVTVSNILNDLTGLGLLRKVDGLCVLVDPDGLSDYAIKEQPLDL